MERQQNKASTNEYDSTLYLNKNIKLGDTIKILIANGIMTPDINIKSSYNLIDKNYAGVKFYEAKILTKDGRVNGLFYNSKMYEDENEFQSDLSKILTFLSKDYKLTKDSTHTEKERLFTYTEREFEYTSSTHIITLSINKKRWKDNFQTTYSFYLSPDIQDSIVKNHHLTNLFYN